MIGRPLDDRELIRRVIAREPGAEQEFVGRYRGLILGLSRGRFRLSHEQAEDVLQATVVRLWEDEHRALRAWRGEGRFSTYLTVIVMRLCLQERAYCGPESKADPESEQHVDPGPLPDEIVASDELADIAAETMKSLSHNQQLVLKLVYRDDRSPAEVAAILGVRSGAARKAIHDAKKRLKTQLMRMRPELFDRTRGDIRR